MSIIQKIINFFIEGGGAVGRTDWKKAPLTDYIFHDVTENEAGEETGETYNYYRYVHPKGQTIIMREKSDLSEYRYATGVWENRTALEYKVYSKL